jgi:predicted alpha/beta superfamily hydrolase
MRCSGVSTCAESSGPGFPSCRYLQHTWAPHHVPCRTQSCPPHSSSNLWIGIACLRHVPRRTQCQPGHSSSNLWIGIACLRHVPRRTQCSPLHSSSNLWIGSACRRHVPRRTHSQCLCPDLCFERKVFWCSRPQSYESHSKHALPIKLVEPH